MWPIGRARAAATSDWPKLHRDKGVYDSRAQQGAAAMGIMPRIARRGIDSSSAAGPQRQVVERSPPWLVGYRRLLVRYERRGDVLLGFVHLACALICLKSLTRPKV